jgi:hypothetical protein
VTLEEAWFLIGQDRGAMLDTVEATGVDLDDSGWIDKRGLWEFQETLVEVLH